MLRGLRFTVEPREPLGVGGERRGEYLDGDLPRQVGVRCAIHLAHPAHADLGGDFVRAEAGAGARAKRGGLYGRGGGVRALLLTDGAVSRPRTRQDGRFEQPDVRQRSANLRARYSRIRRLVLF